MVKHFRTENYPEKSYNYLQFPLFFYKIKDNHPESYGFSQKIEYNTAVLR